jgi:tRNA threonylcarbamoyladenosine biosynthesis protein TsaE
VNRPPRAAGPPAHPPGVDPHGALLYLCPVDRPGVHRLESADAEQTVDIGRRIGRALSPGSIVLLMGELGAGKTTLAKGIARGLGIEDEIISPTYTMVCEYPGETPLYHVDLYRIEGRDQAESLALDDFLWGRGVSLIEWGEKLSMSFPRPPVRISIQILDGGRRIIAVEGVPV